ncbi:MAG: putative DNA binding domain-containing protein [Muribaculaceae bacterium]|nr:putative DNA binding domain-containing protein [Muribaculaceae bacterium]
MTKEDLLERLQGAEWNDFEVKEAKNEVPKSVWETVSAFSNSYGGWIVFGVKESRAGNATTYEVQGVDRAEKVEQDLYCVREALVNFLAHADYFSEIHSTVRVYDNSIQFQNPGSFPVNLDIVGRTIVSQPRNPNILRFFKLAKISENGGYGIDKILN